MSGFGPYQGFGPYPYGSTRTYGSLSLTSTSPVQSFVEPISLLEAKTYLNLPDRSPQDNEENSMVDMFIGAARRQAESVYGRDLVRKQWDLTLDYFWDYEIELRDPLISVDLFQYKDSGGSITAMVENTGYLVNTAAHPGRVTPVFNTFWPSIIPYPTGAILLRFTSGYSPTDTFWSDEGYGIKAGMLMLISAWYNNRLPFDAVRAVSEYPYAVTALFETGALRRVR